MKWKIEKKDRRVEKWEALGALSKQKGVDFAGDCVLIVGVGRDVAAGCALGFFGALGHADSSACHPEHLNVVVGISKSHHLLQAQIQGSTKRLLDSMR